MDELKTNNCHGPQTIPKRTGLTMITNVPTVIHGTHSSEVCPSPMSLPKMIDSSVHPVDKLCGPAFHPSAQVSHTMRGGRQTGVRNRMWLHQDTVMASDINQANRLTHRMVSLRQETQSINAEQNKR